MGPNVSVSVLVFWALTAGLRSVDFAQRRIALHKTHQAEIAGEGGANRLKGNPAYSPGRSHVGGCRLAQGEPAGDKILHLAHRLVARHAARLQAESQP